MPPESADASGGTGSAVAEWGSNAGGTSGLPASVDGLGRGLNVLWGAVLGTMRQQALCLSTGVQ